MRLVTTTALLGLLSSTAFAADWNTRPDDQLLSRADLEQQLVGQTLTFFDDGQSVYSENGEYAYTYGGGGTWLGHYELKDDSSVCVTFVTGVRRCDLIVEANDRLVVITEDGLRFPIR
ncbi:hypothetical protein SAMN04488030_1645 [Aliiroseovarius halocynthiae]|uniref:Dihydrodipicolinate reductase n=1 Tax=Aliiroseovarius halocynthiae TaxID=985055 RepID=A0A545SX12_9RHOB|nr:hypothetical protein [Aliiroseovarius halocynthiae]TQV69500.1 hypothetical protein FIL88_08130 [Aliiroseovarius halocynthiae]SMR72900.1 hypothetical protein SAMN04488030_1645 [Aliiroseovarius halocynthiae]